jgi:hypothetical protein
MRERPLTVAEVLVSVAWCVLALVITVAYLWGRVGRISPYALLGFSAAAGVLIALRLLRRARRNTAVAVTTVALVVAVSVWLFWHAAPWFLPPGGGPELAHHLMLVDYIGRHWQLPTANLGETMAEMAHYTPGLHLSAALAGAWLRSDGFHTIYAVVVLTFALKCALVFLVGLRTLGVSQTRIPLALGAVLLSLLPQAYVTGSFLHDSFLAQAAAELFAVAMWWAAVVWDARPHRLPLILFASAGVGAFLTWPMWIGPPTVAFTALVLARGELPIARRIGDVSIAVLPVVAFAVLHAVGRVGWLAIAGTSGAVLHPSIAAFGWPFIAFASAGTLIGLFDRRARATLLLLLSAAAQAATLYVLALRSGADTPYMALKMVYLMVYPLGVLGALAVAFAGQLLRARFGERAPRRSAPVVAWTVLIVAAAITVWRPSHTATHEQSIVSSDLYDAGRWARAQLEAACVDYLVPHADTAYWLHLAVLGNPRSSLRSANPDTFEPARAVARWIEPGGLPYAIAYLPTLPKEVLNDVDMLEQFGDAAVVKRRALSFCPDAQRLARLTSHAVNVDGVVVKHRRK